LQEVRLGDDTCDRFVDTADGEAGDPMLEHQGRCLNARSGVVDRNEVERRDRVDRTPQRVLVSPLGGDVVDVRAQVPQHVAVGDDGDDSTPVLDQAMVDAERFEGLRAASRFSSERTVWT
jgi:hypothetical protein